MCLSLSVHFGVLGLERLLYESQRWCSPYLALSCILSTVLGSFFWTHALLYQVDKMDLRKAVVDKVKEALKRKAMKK